MVARALAHGHCSPKARRDGSHTARQGADESATLRVCGVAVRRGELGAREQRRILVPP
jgi:hypothetical protein